MNDLKIKNGLIVDGPITASAIQGVVIAKYDGSVPVGRKIIILEDGTKIQYPEEV